MEAARREAASAASSVGKVEAGGATKTAKATAVHHIEDDWVHRHAAHSSTTTSAEHVEAIAQLLAGIITASFPKSIVSTKSTRRAAAAVLTY